MTDFLQPGQHPDADQLSAFAELALPPHEREQMLTHLALCEQCRSIVALALPPLEDAAPQLPQPIPLRKPWYAGWNLLWPTGGALAAAALLILTLRHTPVTGPQSNSPQTASEKPPTIRQPPPQPPAISAIPPTSKPRVSTGVPAKTPAALAQQNVLTGTAMPAPLIRPATPPSTASPPAQSDAVLDLQQIENIPMNGRNALDLSRQNLPKASASSQPVNRSVPRPQVATVSSYDQSASSDMVEVTAAAPQLRESYAARSIAPLVLANFPGRLPIAASGSVAGHTLALDAAGALFLSDNGGRQWRSVSTPWRGRVAMLQVTAFPTPSANSRKTGTLAIDSVANASGAGSINEAAGAELTASPASRGEAIISDSGIAPAAASLSGVVADTTGAVIVGASVIATNTQTGQARRATSDKNGRYTLPSLAGGTYQLSFQSPGFSQQQQSLLLAANAQASINPTLTPSSSNSTVSVSAQMAPLLHTEDAILGETIPNRAVAEVQPLLHNQVAPVFQITTSTGDRWTSTDGKQWSKH